MPASDLWGSHPDHVLLAGGLQHFPGALEAGPEHEGVAGAQYVFGTALFGDHRHPGKDVAELPLLIFDAPFSRGGFPYAGIKPAVRLLRVPRCEARVAGDDPALGRRADLGLPALGDDLHEVRFHARTPALPG